MTNVKTFCPNFSDQEKDVLKKVADLWDAENKTIKYFYPRTAEATSTNLGDDDTTIAQDLTKEEIILDNSGY